MIRSMQMAVCALVLGCAPAGAWAANDGRADPDLLLGELNTYSDHDAAERACGVGQVVWADRFAGFFYGSREPKYGATDDGSYACRSDAQKARYWSTDPRDGMEGHPGRTFPFERLFFGS